MMMMAVMAVIVIVMAVVMGMQRMMNCWRTLELRLSTAAQTNQNPESEPEEAPEGRSQTPD